MNNGFDELAKSLAQSVTRRGALKQFGFGLASLALATLGLANKAHATNPPRFRKNCDHCNSSTNYGCPSGDAVCFEYCYNKCTNPGGDG